MISAETTDKCLEILIDLAVSSNQRFYSDPANVGEEQITQSNVSKLQSQHKPQQNFHNQSQLSKNISSKRNKLVKHAQKCRSKKSKKEVYQTLDAYAAMKKKEGEDEFARKQRKAEEEFRKDPNKYQKKLFQEEQDRVYPKFSFEEGVEYFKKQNEDPQKDKEYMRPSFLPKVPKKKITAKAMPEVDLETLKKVLNHKNAASAPGPDGIGNMYWKKLPAFHELIIILLNRCIREISFPTAWRNGNLVLIYKKGDPSLPKNFRPICLTSCLSKIYTSLLGRHLMSHMTSNKLFIGSQKGFMSEMSGCIEHQFSIEEVIKRIRRGNGRRAVLILTDLTNAFGTVRHSLIRFALDYYKFDDQFKSIIQDMYQRLSFNFKMDNQCAVIMQNIGVFQGDSLSAQLFNVVINLILTPLNHPDLRKNGACMVNRHRITTLAIADDVNLLANNKINAQKLLNVFKTAIEWTECLSPAPAKFGVIGYQKVERHIDTFFPELKYGDTVIPALGDEQGLFRVLGQQFPADGRPEHVQTFVKKKIEHLMKLIDDDPLPDNLKLLMYKDFFHYHARWPLMVHSLSIAWVKTELKSIVNRYLKSWTGAAHSMNEHLFYISCKENGLGLPDNVKFRDATY